MDNSPALEKVTTTAAALRKAAESGTTEQIETLRANAYGKAVRAALAKHSFADITIASGFTAEQVTP